MFQQLWTITRNTFTESLRQPVFLVVVLAITLLLIMALTWSAYTLDDDNKLLIDMSLSMIFVGGLLLAAFTATGVLSREIENKTVLTVISKPVSRPLFVIGKFFGVAGAISVAFWIWSLAFLLALRHEVMMMAAQRIDMPVVAFGLGALALALGVTLWGNYFYGWVFSSRFVALFAVALTIGYLLVLMIDKQWQFQPITAEFTKAEGRLGQVLIALLLVFEGLMVLSAVAIACSTRLGQVMTLVVCAAVWSIGMLSDWLFQDFIQSPFAWIGYAMAPNMQFLWLADALTQQNPVSGTYVVLVTSYILLYTLAVLALAVALFQTRETG